MKNTITGFVLALVSVAVFSSNAKAWAPTCITSATYQAGTYSPGEPVLFDASGSSPIGTAGGHTPYWRWDFNYNGSLHWDTTTYTPQCYHAFSAPGTYTVAVAYFDSYGSAGQPYPFTMSITITQWDWTHDVAQTLYYTGASGPTSISWPLPWWDNQSYPYQELGEFPQNEIDFTPQQGWVLLYKDFGSGLSSVARGLPWFLLYNKYRGILRMFFWDSQIPTTYSYGDVQLTIGQTSSPLFTFNSGVPSYVSDYPTSGADTFAVSTISQLAPDQWCFADFNLAGYDSLIGGKNSYLNFKILGITSGQLKANGSELLDAIMGPGQTAQSVQSSGGVKSEFASANKEIQNVNQLYTQFKNMGAKDSTPLGTALQSLVSSVASSPLGLIPGISQVAGFVNGFIGLLTGGAGGNQNTAAIPLKYKGDVTLSGTLNTNYVMSYPAIPVPGSAQSSSLGAAGYYNKPLGIFNIVTQPTLRYCNLPTDIVYGPGGQDAFGPFMVAIDPFKIVYNSAPGMTLVSKTYAILDTNYGPMTGYHPLDSCQDLSFILQKYSSNGLGGTEYGQPAEFMPGVPTTLGPSPVSNGIALSLDLKFRYFNSTTATWDTVFFLKTYPVNVVADTSIFDRPGWILSKAAKSPMIVENKAANLPTHYSIQNYPNPFNPTATVRYSLVKQSRVSVRVYDILGQQVATLADGVKSAGYYNATFDGSHLASGIYFIRLVAQPLAGGSTVIRTEKAMLVK